MNAGLSDNPYLKASFIPKLKETKTIFLTDLDGTHATRVGSDREMKDRASVRKVLDARRYVAGAVTARTPALTMSSGVYEASRTLGFTEPPPLCGFDGTDPDGKRRKWVPIEELPFFNESLDWDMVAGMGSGVWPRNGHGYLLDRDFDLSLKYDYARGQHLEKGVEPLAWREAALLLLLEWPWVVEHFSPIESMQNYLERKVDVAPLPYRIQLNFKGEAGLARMRELKHLLLSSINPVARRMSITDESKPDKNEYVMYLMPWAGRKERMINHFIRQSAEAARISLTSLRLFYAGDTPTDLRAGLYSGTASPLTFLLATGSALAPYLAEQRPSYGDESLNFLWEGNGMRKRRFIPTNEKGIYHFKVGGRRWVNTIVIGDERYPGTTPPGSVLQFLDEFAQPKSAGH